MNTGITRKIADVSRRYHKERSYWLDKMAGERSESCFPYYDTDIEESAGAPQEHRWEISGESFSRLRRLSSDSDPTLHIILVASCTALLAKYCGNRDIVTGVPVYRQEEQADFVNTVLPLRQKISGDNTFKDLLVQVKDTLLEAVDHQNYPMEALAQELSISLFDVSVLLENIHDEAYLDHIPHHMRFLFSRNESGLEAVIKYDSRRYSPEYIHRVRGHFMNLLETVLEDLDQPFSSIDILSEAERMTFLTEFNNTASPNPPDLLLHQLFEHQAEKTPQTEAIHSTVSLTYKELNEQADQLASDLIAEGISPDVIVGIKMNRSVQLITGILAILKAGAAYLPIDPSLPAERIDYMLQDSGAKHLLYTDKQGAIQFTPTLPKAQSPLERGARRRRVGCVDVGGPPPPSGAGQYVSSLAYIIYTSGTTGKPKAVAIEHRGAVNYITWAAKTYVKDENVAFPLYTGIAFDLTVTSIFTPLATGNTIYIYEGDDREPLIERVINDNKTGIVKLTPAHLKLAANSLSPSTSRIRRLILGGEDLETQTAQTVHRAFNGNIEIYNEYGPTETVVGSMIHRYDPATDTHPSVSIGHPIANTSIYLLDRDYNPVPVGVPGEIYIGGAGVARGYLNRPELTAEKFVPPPAARGSFEKPPLDPAKLFYRTGDLAVRLEDGSVRFLGRIDQQVKVRGFRVELGEIEHVLKQFKAQKQTASILEEPVPQPGDLHHTVRCTRCLMSANQPGIHFDNDGVCRVCREYESYEEHVKNYFKTPLDLEQLLDTHKRPTAKYDVLLLFSGGKDSTYALYKLMDLGLKVLTFTFDNGYISPAAFENIRRTTTALKVDHIIGDAKNMKKVFVESLRSNHSVCHGCWHAINTYGVQIAHEHGIDLVVSGLSRGQIFEMRLHPLFQTGAFDEKEIDEKLLLFRKRFHAFDNKFSRILTTGLEEEVVETVRFLDFFRYIDTPVEQIKQYLDHKGWVQPKDTGFCSSNCKINDTGIYMHLKLRNTHFYEAPLSWDVRMGQLSRDAGLKETLFQPEPRGVDQVLKEIGYYDAAAAEDVVVIDKTDKNGNTYLCAYIVSPSTLIASGLRSYLAEHLPGYMIPSQWFQLDSIPLSAGGKVDRKALAAAEALGRRLSTGAKYIAPTDENEILMAAFFREILDLERVGVEDNFFELGATSFEIVQASNHLAKEFGRDIPVLKLFEYPTIASFLDYFNGSGETGAQREARREAKQEETIDKGKARFAKRRQMRK
jgi:amino acid adenylation domain-containing protein